MLAQNRKRLVPAAGGVGRVFPTRAGLDCGSLNSAPSETALSETGDDAGNLTVPGELTRERRNQAPGNVRRALGLEAVKRLGQASQV